MQNTKNQARGSGIHARHTPTNDKTVSDDLQNVSGNIVAPPRYRLTKLGEQMARLPIDPKIARILLAAKKHDCMAEILVIASALSIQDPRERPLEARDAAAKAHERFTDKQSDFLAYLNIWDSFQRERDKGLSNKQLVQWCRQYFLSHLRMREWRELHHQLAQTAIEMGLTTKEAAFRRPPEVRQLTSSENAGDQDLSAKLKQKQLDKKQHRAQIRAAKEAGYEQIHRALLTGLIANVGMKSPDGNDYTGARGSRFHLFPASALFKAKPKWVMAAELVETTKLYARDVAAIQPEWIEQEAPHLVRYHYFEPHWEQKRGEVIASERVTLYGLTLLPRRPVSYGRIAPEEAREIFIRSALVAQECDLKADFFVHNKKLIKEITELEHKSRKQDVLVDDEALFAFYNERLPEIAWKDAQGSVWGSEDSVRIIESDKADRSSEKECGEFRQNERNGSRQNENHGNTVGWVENPTPAATVKTVGFDNPTYDAQQPAPSPVGEGRGEGKTVTAQTNFSATAASPLPQEREQSTAASTVSDDPKAQRLPENSLCYADGQPILLGDRVTIDSKQWHGKIVALIAEQQCDTSIGSAEEWATLQSGVMAQFDEAGLVHYPDAETAGELILLARADAADVLKSQKDNRVREPSSHTLQNVSDDPKPKKQPAPPKGRLKPLPLADIRTFQAWLKTAERDNPRLLFLSRDDLMQHAAAHITEEQFPKHWQTADGKFKLSYRFEPHHPLDGVTLTLPLTVLNRISPAALEWLVPGMIREKIQLQIKALPKQIRRICVPVPEFITQFLSQNPDRNAPILPQLAQAIAKTAGDIRILEQINQDEWAAFRLPEHCYFNLRIIDDGGQELAMGRDLIQIQQQLGKAAATTFRDNTQEFERDNVTAWDIGTLPESIKFARGKQQLTGYLGLQKEKDGRIALRLFDTSAAAEQAHRLGVIELMKLQLKEQVKDLNKGIQGFTQAAMLLKHINADTLRDDLTQAVCDRAFIGEDELPRNEKAFKEQIKRARSRLPAVKEALSRYLQETAAAYAELNGKLGKHPLTQLMRQRLQTLLAAGFATRTPWAQWPRLPIYLKAMTLRLEKYSSNPARDAAREADIQELEQMWQEKTDSLVKQGQPVSDDLAAFKWMIEELRVSLFAQELKTPYPVSVKRLLKEWENTY
ncbi:ATP-dependent helicase [Neisseria sp. HMSC072F04]|nr:ATP-dependent helicase [Neisseria sp. HMSC072F04]